MDVREAIEKRRTIRAFKKPVNEEMLLRLIWLGSRAPSGSNTQPWEFIIINDRKIIDEIAEQKGRQESLRGGKRRVAIEKGLYDNSSVVAICNKKGSLSAPAAWMAALNMALAATGEGIGCVMSILGGEYREVIEKLLKIPDTHELATVLALGEPAGEWPTERAVGEDRPDFSWLHYDTFGNQK